MEDKIESKVAYDDRRKELTQFMKSIQEIKIDGEIVGGVTAERKAVFKEDGIRKILADLQNQQTKIEQTIKQLNHALKDTPEMSEELIELEKKIQEINTFNKNKQLKSQIETNEKDLKLVKKDIQDIKEAIGSRLNL